MFSLSIAVMLAGATALPSYTLPPARPVAKSKCAKDCAERYRLPTSSDNDDASKYRALNEDGTDCNVTRAKICRNPTRTWVRANY